MNPWAIIGAIGILFASNVGTYFYSAHHEALSWKLASQTQSAVAEALRAKIISDHANKDAAASEFARNLDQVKTNADKTNADDAIAARAAYTLELRRIAASRPSCASVGITEALNSERLANSARERQNRLLEEIAGDLAEVGAGANDLAGIVRDIAVPWAKEHGR